MAIQAKMIVTDANETDGTIDVKMIAVQDDMNSSFSTDDVPNVSLRICCQSASFDIGQLVTVTIE